MSPLCFFVEPIAPFVRKMRVLLQERDTSGITDSSVITYLSLVQPGWIFELASCCIAVGPMGKRDYKEKKRIYFHICNFSSFPIYTSGYTFVYSWVGADETSFSKSKAFSNDH